MVDVNIVIVTYNMKEKVEMCLRSLFADIKTTSLDVSVVVVDNNSNDDTKTMIKERFPSVHLISLDENVGFGKAQNKGFAHTNARYYFALNPDTEFPTHAHTIERLYQFMKHHPNVGMIGPKIIYPDGTLQYSCWRFPTMLQPLYNRTKLGETKRGMICKAGYHMTAFDHNSTIPVDSIMGSAMFVRGSAMKEVGMFDERYFMYFEDIDWSIRMWESGWPVYYVHDIVITHMHGRGSATTPGIFHAFVTNRLFRIHISSWLKFVWKWKHAKKYYAVKY